MDGLDEFEKSLAAEIAERDRTEVRSHRKHRHHDSEKSADKEKHRHRSHSHKHRHHRSREQVDDSHEGGHRHKRPRQSRNEEVDTTVPNRHRALPQDRLEDYNHDSKDTNLAGGGRPDHIKTSDPKADLPLPDEEVTTVKILARDDWMTNPSALGIDYVERGKKHELTPAPKEPTRAIHDREINTSELQHLNEGKDLDELKRPAQHNIAYTIGDDGSQWRMTKLKAVYNISEQSGRSLEDVAIERFGSLREFDDAREERIELDRRSTYGHGYVGKEKPSGELFQERKLQSGVHEPRESNREHGSLDQDTIIPEEVMNRPTATIDQSTLNKMRAQMMKAKLRKAPEAVRLEAEYNEAVGAYAAQGPGAVVLGIMDNRMLAGSRAEAKAVDSKRGRERGQMVENDEMTIEDMLREERRTRGQRGGEGLRLAERIAKDDKFDDDLEYMDENAERLAKRIQKSEINIRNTAVSDYQKINSILDKCQLCHHEDKNQPPVAPIISLGTRVYLTLPTEPELSDGGAVVVPVQHRTNLLECDDDEWEEIRNFMKCLTRMYHDQGREIVFYENAAAPQRHMHAALHAVPIPYDQGDTVSAFFKEAMLSADEEWAQHKKVIDTGSMSRNGMGKLAFRRSIAKEMPYFHVWFTLDGGLGHVVEDANRWPRGDLFAREVLGGMMDVAPDIIKRQGRWRKDDSRVEGFRKRWRKFDWTRVLSDG